MQKWHEEEDDLRALWRNLNDAHCVRCVLLIGQPLIPTSQGHIFSILHLPQTEHPGYRVVSDLQLFLIAQMPWV